MNLNGIEIRWLGHSAFKIIVNGKNIYIDPFKVSESNDADYVLITHPHYDHCSIEDLQKVVKEGTRIIAHVDCESKIARLSDGIEIKPIALGQKLKLEDLEVEAVPAYNTNKEFHTKSQEWLGFIITIKGKRIYHAGDTDLIEEMENFKDIDLALLPVSGTYVMTAEEAVEAAKKIKPKLAVPMHYASIVGSEEDANKFISLCEQAGIKAEKMKPEN